MQLRTSLPLLAVLGVLSPSTSHATISFLSGTSIAAGGEIVSFDRANALVLTTNSNAAGGAENHQINLYSVSGVGALTLARTVDLNSTFGGATNIFSVSSVAADPLGRDFGVASIIPKTSNTTLGQIALFQLSTGTVLKTLDVGYHPDSVSFTPDGAKILVANEAELVTTGAQAPGSVSLVNVAGIGAGASGVAGLNSTHVTDVNFSTSLASGVTLAGLRNNRLDTLANKTPSALDVEPEYIASTNTHAFVTLQEANAVAVIDLATSQVSAIHRLGTINQRIDASDRDGSGNSASIQVNDTVAGMAMPDTIATFTRGGTTYYATANEGDAHISDNDVTRGASANIDATVKAGLDVTNTGIGRLNLSNIDGDTDMDGDIDVPTMFGTRSFSIRDAVTGALVFDSGSMIEDYVAANNPGSFNINNGSIANLDGRSDDKGPEPEALAFGSVDGRDYMFVGAERENGIFQFDITDLGAVAITGYYNTITGTLDSGGAFVAPESIQFISGSDSPTGFAMLLVGYEGTGANGSIALFQVHSTSAIPEPSTYALLFGAGGLGFALWRRRSTRRV